MLSSRSLSHNQARLCPTVHERAVAHAVDKERMIVTTQTLVSPPPSASPLDATALRSDVMLLILRARGDARDSVFLLAKNA